MKLFYLLIYIYLNTLQIFFLPNYTFNILHIFDKVIVFFFFYTINVDTILIIITIVFQFSRERERKREENVGIHPKRETFQRYSVFKGMIFETN